MKGDGGGRREAQDGGARGVVLTVLGAVVAQEAGLGQEDDQGADASHGQHGTLDGGHDTVVVEPVYAEYLSGCTADGSSDAHAAG